MKTIRLSQALRPLAEYAAELGDEVVVLTDRDKPVAAIVPDHGYCPVVVGWPAWAP